MSNSEDKKTDELENELSEKEQEQKEKLNDELEQIRSLFQTELDLAKESASQPESEEEETEESAEDESNEDESNEDESKEADPEDLCACCGENERDTSVSHDYQYCAECRESMRHYPVSWKAVLLLVAVVACVFFAVWDNYTTLPMFAKVLQAETAADKNNVNESAELYYNLETNVLKKPSKRVAEGQAKVYYKLGYLDDMISIVESNFSEKELQKPWNKELNECYQKAKSLSMAADEVSEIVNKYMESEDKNFPIDEALAALNKVSEKKEKSEEKAVVAYYKYYCAYVAKRPAEELYTYLDEIRQADETQKWLYGADMAKTLVEMGKYDEAMNLCSELGKEFRDDSEYYAIRATAYRRQEQYDKSLEQIEAGLKIDSESYSCLRQKAIVYLLKGNFDKAQDAAGEAYTMYPNSYETSYTYALTCLANNDTEEYEAVVANLKDYEETMGQTVLDYKDGKITIEQIFLEGKGDVV